MSKKSEPARAMAIRASPATEKACVRASLANGVLTKVSDEFSDRGLRRGRQPVSLTGPIVEVGTDGPSPARGSLFRIDPSLPATRGPAGQTRPSACLRRLVLVAQPADRHDPRGVAGIVLDLGSEPLDVDVEGLGVAHVVEAPHPVD